MIRAAVPAMGMLVDVLEWDGNEEELRSFTVDEFFGIDPDGVTWTGSSRPGVRRPLAPGDLLVRPAGRTDVSPLHLFREHWWVRELGLLA